MNRTERLARFLHEEWLKAHFGKFATRSDRFGNEWEDLRPAHRKEYRAVARALLAAQCYLKTIGVLSRG
jgi:hypothetical protein